MDFYGWCIATIVAAITAILFALLAPALGAALALVLLASAGALTLGKGLTLMVIRGKAADGFWHIIIGAGIILLAFMILNTTPFGLLAVRILALP